MGERFVKFMNAVTKLRRSRCRADELLVLLPSCLQNSDCTEKLTADVQNCRRCGRCKVKDVLELADRYGFHCAMATGGRLAMKLARDEGVKAIVAVACEQELHEGMSGVFPKPSLGVINLRPHGPCTDTDVDLEELEEAIGWILRD